MPSLGHVAVGMAAGRWWTARAPGPGNSIRAMVAFSALARARSRRDCVPPRDPLLRLWLLCTAVAASHGLLDALTSGGLGIALFWPFSNQRFFAPWTPIPVSPIGAGMLSARGLRVALTEALQFAPLLAWALWPRQRVSVPAS